MQVIKEAEERIYVTFSSVYEVCKLFTALEKSVYKGMLFHHQSQLTGKYYLRAIKYAFILWLCQPCLSAHIAVRMVRAFKINEYQDTAIR